MILNDPEAVRTEYASERGLEGRRAAYRYADGPDPREIAFAAIGECEPGRVLEVGAGPGELAERIRRELAAAVVAVDISPRMVELARGRGVDARVGDVQDLAFADGEFDCAVAAWMLYHVPDIDRALAELARVLRPGGRLVAVTNFLDHLLELRELVGLWRREATCFSGDNGEELLRHEFACVEAREAGGTIRFPGYAAVQSYFEASRSLLGDGELPPFACPLDVRTHPVIFVAEKA